jgi:hypothetical protein
MRVLLFFLAINCYISNVDNVDMYLNNFKYLPKEFFKVHKYIINYYNTLPLDIAKEYYMIDVNILQKMEQEGYKLLINKEHNNESSSWSVMVVKKPMVKIYHNDIKQYIKFYIPGENYLETQYKTLENNYINNKLFLFYQSHNKLIMAVNFNLEHCCLINRNTLIKSSLEIKQQNNFNYLIISQKQLFFIKNIQYKHKNKSLILKIYYGKKPLIKYANSINNSKGIMIPNILNLKENLIFYPEDFSSKYFINENNPKIIGYNNLCTINTSKSLEHKSNLKIQGDIPLINYLIILNDKKNDTNLLEKGENNFKEIEHYYNKLNTSSDLKKEIDFFPTFPLDTLYNIIDDNPAMFNYVDMISNFFYSKIKKFNENFKKFYKFNEFYMFYPFINDLNYINENLFWLMVYLIPFNKFSKNNIVLLIKYSYGFPSIIRDKINSFIIYNLYLQKEFFIINYIFENKYINYTLDFITNLIYVETKIFNGITIGKDLFELKFHKENLLESTLIIQKLLYKKRKILKITELIKDLKNILEIYKTYKIILSKENESQLFNLLSYLGQFNYTELEKISLDSIINLNLVIKYIKINNPKKYQKYYYNHGKEVKNNDEKSIETHNSQENFSKEIKNNPSTNKLVTNLLKKKNLSNISQNNNEATNLQNLASLKSNNPSPKPKEKSIPVNLIKKDIKKDIKNQSIHKKYLPLNKSKTTKKKNN